MKKILLISGSERNGNCKQILEEIQQTFWLEYSTEVVFIRDFDMKPCMGCKGCDNSENHECIKQGDKSHLLLDKINDSEIIVLATPNYFYNVSGLTKTFIDKTYPCYRTKSLKGKKFIYIYIGEDETQNTKKYLDNALYGFTDCHEINVLGSYAYSASGIGEFANVAEKVATTQSIINKIWENIR